MKKLFTMIFAFFSPLIYAFDIVHDPVSLEKNLVEWGRQYTAMQDQLSKMENQYREIKAQHEALTGNRNLGSIFDDKAYRDYLPPDWQQVYDKAKKEGYAGLSPNAQNLYKTNQIYDECAYINADDERKVCQAKAAKNAVDEDIALETYQKAKNRIEQINKLMNKINDTKDPKAIAELQARIAVEQANIQNEQTKLQMYAMVTAAESKVQEQRQSEIQARAWAKDQYIQAKPVQFNPK